MFIALRQSCRFVPNRSRKQFSSLSVIIWVGCQLQLNKCLIMFKILFVCTGNICRSPLAEAVSRHKLEQSGLSGRVQVDSAGTHGYHIGDRPDPRTLKIAHQNGIPTDGITARQVKTDDFEQFDLILAMDSGHLRHLLAMADPIHHHKIRLFLEHAGLENGQKDVADPYYGDFSDFEDMYHVIDKALKNIDNILYEKKV